jgi:DNA-binding LacI/PurR family transcriptional regulator
MPTIKDVAKKANVSVATVSRVINNTGYVNIETRKLVESAIQELNYVPNELARNLFRKTSGIIGLIVPHISTYFFAELIEAIEDAATKKGYKLMIFNSKNDVELEKKYLQVFSQYNIDGLILVSNTKSPDDYKKLSIPMITIDHIIDDTIPSITSNNYQGGKLAAELLIKNNPQKIIHFRGPMDLITVRERNQGFDDVLRAHQIHCFSKDLDFKNPSTYEIKDFIEMHRDVKAIFCSSDIIAFYVMNVLRELHYKIPQDVSIIGYDNIELSGVIYPKLTTIAQPINQIGSESIDVLLTLIKKKPLKTKHIILPVKLIERETTKKHNA